jgi:lysophospholipid acyltransferase (LPLAT)-like uncharacterized protein
VFFRDRWQSIYMNSPNQIEKIKIGLISTLGYWIIRIIGGTLRWEIKGLPNIETVLSQGKRVIMTFWHGRILMATYYFRNRGIVVMTSQNRDGEYIARVIQRFGYRAARGSSTRGSHGAVAECLRAMTDGHDVGITIDGPRGPRYVAKPGAAYLARKSGNPVLPFSISVEKKWVMRSWDHFQVPKPFTRAVVLIGDSVHVDTDATEEEMAAAEAKVQQALDELRDQGDSWWGGVPDR